MPHNITPIDAFTLPVTVPDNTDSGTNRAGDVENIAQTLANQTHHLNTHSVKLDQANTITAAPQTIDTASSSIAALYFAKGAHDHPGSVQNRWKLVMQFHLSSGEAVRLYIGEGDFGDGSCFAITTNARWDPTASGSGGQKWGKDQDLKESNIWRMVLGGEAHYYGRQPGGGSWTDSSGWTSQQRGNFFVGDTLTAHRVHSTQHVNADDQLTAGGDCNVGNDVNCTHSINAGDFIRCGQDFNYTTSKARLTILPLTWAHGADFKNFQGEYILTGSSVVNFPVHLPHGSILNSVDVMYTKAGSSSVSTFAVRKHSINWSTPTAPTSQQVGTTVNSSGPGLYVINTTFGNLTVNKDEDYELVVQDGDNNDKIWALRVHWTDPGPRNF